MRAAVALRAAALYPDGVVELRVAEALLAGRWGEALDTRFHPLLGLLTALAHSLSGADVELVALAICALSSATLALTLGWAAALLCPRAPARAAFFAGTCAAVHPYLARLGGQVLAYGPSHACLALGLALALHAALRRRATSALLAGAALGLGYWARSDALASAAGLAAGLLLAGLLERRRDVQPRDVQPRDVQPREVQPRDVQPRPPRAAAPEPARGLVLRPLAFVLGAGLLIAPYAGALSLHAGEPMLSPKKPLRSLLPGSARAPSPTPTPSDEATLAELIGAAIGRPAPSSAATLPSLPSAAAFALRKAAGAAHPLLLLLALAALLPGLPGLRGPPRPAPAYALPLLGLLAFVGAHVILRASWGYTSRLHQSAAAVFLIPLAAAGLTRVASRARGLSAALLAALILTSLPRALEPQHVGKGVERAVGAWLSRYAGGPTVVCGRGEVRGVAYRAGARFVDLAPHRSARDALARARAQGARYLVLYLRSREEPATGPLFKALADLGARRVGPEFRSQHQGRRYRYVLFRL